MKKITTTVFLIFFGAYLNAQSLSSFDSDINNSIYNIRNAFSNKITVDELEDEIEVSQRKISYLLDDIKDTKSISKDSKEYKELLLKAKELESFARSNNCECLHTFKKLFSQLGASNAQLIEKNGVRVMQASIGNFIIFYAYGLEKKLYKVSVELQHNKPNGYGTVNCNFGLANEVETFQVVSKSENWKIKSLNVEISYDLNYVPLECGNDYPRN